MRIARTVVGTALLGWIVPLSAQEPVSWGSDLVFHTFSIAAVDPQTGESGVAVTTRVACVGNGVPWGGDEVFSMVVYDDDLGGGPALYVGGAFEVVDGKSISNIARWDGSEWTSVGIGLRDPRTKCFGRTPDIASYRLYGVPLRRVLLAGRWDHSDFSLTDLR